MIISSFFPSLRKYPAKTELNISPIEVINDNINIMGLTCSEFGIHKVFSLDVNLWKHNFGIARNTPAK
jgi:hypothetical protein